MSNNDAGYKIFLPKITNASFKNFDLYTNEPNISVDIEKNVFCLIGANGLGKSTFLNSIIFAITGAIPTSNRKFLSAHDYFKNISKAKETEEYFNGRVAEHQRETASISVTLEWDNYILKITRNFFSANKFKKLIIKDKNSGAISEYVEKNGVEINKIYQDEIRKLTGLNDFTQFVFLIHFISLFDESRHLLMWDSNVLTNALYLAFGTDPSEAQDADKLQKEMERESSRGRNAKYSARQITNRINNLLSLVQDDNESNSILESELNIKHDELKEYLTLTQERLNQKQNELKESQLNWADHSATLASLQIEYNKIFSSRVKKITSFQHHPLIQASLSECRCAMCGNEDSRIVESLEHKIKMNECPMCGHSAEDFGGNQGEMVSQLKSIDREMNIIKEQQKIILSKIKRYQNELDAAEAENLAAERAIREFENKESYNLDRINSLKDNSSLTLKIEKMQRERESFLEQGDEHYSKRDALREKLRTYERKLKGRYENSAEAFVLRFRELAESFIGLPVDVSLDHKKGSSVSGFGLNLKMNDKLRSSPDKLSESQRFFIDIALRMALTEFMCEGPATLFIDTPEGSLDIAYEARAGSMFSKYVSEGNSIVMTANLRSSHLVLRLAGLEKQQNMQLIRMTEWTELTEVQKSEESLFLNAYNEIESVMH